jgi:predicted transcriptional regulator
MKGVVNVSLQRYNDLGVITVAVEREHVKALIDRLSDEQVQALWVILNSIAWAEVEISPEDEADIKEGLADLESGRKVRAVDVWKELGI